MFNLEQVSDAIVGEGQVRYGDFGDQRFMKNRDLPTDLLILQF